MKIGFREKNKGQNPGTIFHEWSITFTTETPVIVQPAEIIKIQTGIFIKIEWGPEILSINTHPELVSRTGELFGGEMVLHGFADYVQIPVRNGGRNPLHLMPGQPIAMGRIVPIQMVFSEQIEVTLPETELSASTPQKRNPGIKFELR